MDCCLLSSEEVGRLRHYKITPDHTEHIHISSKFAIEGLKDETFELVDLGDGRYAVTKTKMYFLQRRPSGGPGGIDTIQRVIAPQLEVLMPLR